MITAVDVARTMARSAIAVAMPPELAAAELLAGATSDPGSLPYLAAVAAAIVAGYVTAGYDRAGRFVYEATEAGRTAAGQVMTGPLETPGVLTCSAQYADKNRYELTRHVRAGGVVRIVDLRNCKVLEYRSQEQPACIAGMPDDLLALWRAQRERQSKAARERAGSLTALRETRERRAQEAAAPERVQARKATAAAKTRRYRARKRQEKAS